MHVCTWPFFVFFVTFVVKSANGRARDEIHAHG